MKNCNMISNQKQQNYQNCHQVQLMNMNTLKVKKLPSDQIRVTEKATFTYSHLGNVLEKQIKAIEDAAEKQAKAIKDRVKK